MYFSFGCFVQGFEERELDCLSTFFVIDAAWRELFFLMVCSYFAKSLW